MKLSFGLLSLCVLSVTNANSHFIKRAHSVQLNSTQIIEKHHGRLDGAKKAFHKLIHHFRRSADKGSIKKSSLVKNVPEVIEEDPSEDGASKKEEGKTSGKDKVKSEDDSAKTKPAAGDKPTNGTKPDKVSRGIGNSNISSEENKITRRPLVVNASSSSSQASLSILALLPVLFSLRD